MKETYCPYRKFRQLFNGGKKDEVSEGWCSEDEHPCQQENGRCRISLEIEAYISKEENLEEVESES